MKRKPWIIALLVPTLVLLATIRIKQAKAYMQHRIERLTQRGIMGYEIHECHYLSFADYSGFPCITVLARRPNEDYSISVDFPWIPFMTPETKI